MITFIAFPFSYCSFVFQPISKYYFSIRAVVTLVVSFDEIRLCKDNVRLGCSYDFPNSGVLNMKHAVYTTSLEELVFILENN